MWDVLPRSQRCSAGREGSLCHTFSAGSPWWLPGCKSPHRALSGCKVSVWRRSFCEGECSLSVDMSEGRKAKKSFSVCVLTKTHQISARLRACHGSSLVLSLIPAEAAPSQARVHRHTCTHPCTLSPAHAVLKTNLCLNLPFSSTGVSGTLKCASCYVGRFWLN